MIAARDTPNGRNVVLGLGTDQTVRMALGDVRPGSVGGHVVDGDRVFLSVANPNGAIYALDRGNGHQIWERPLAGDLQAIPVVAGDAVYVAGTEGIVAVDKATGAVRWSWPLGPVLGAGLAVTGGLVIATTRDAHGGGRRHGPRRPHRPAPCGPSIGVRSGIELALAATRAHPRPERGPSSGRTLLLSTAVAPDGTTYVADIDNSRILIRHPDGKIESWGQKGSGHGQFDFTEVTRNDQSGGVAISPDGKLIAVGDGSNHRVQLFDSSRTWLRWIGRLRREDGQFVNPYCVTIDAQARIWVVDVAQPEVQVFDSRGVHLRTFGEQGSSEGQLDRPGSVFIDPGSDEVFVPDFANRRVSVFSDDGTWLRDYDRHLNPALDLDEVNAVVVDAAGRLFVVDATSRIFVIEHDGALLTTIGNQLPTVGAVGYTSFAIDAAGKLTFADIGHETEARIIVSQLLAPIWPPR